ncbi:MAG: signal peptidase II [Mycoplasmataceae bacterium]|jgi:lipoprotein signal peptidase|nr:signal peptidase II [Mycoplasmataceae bacterium]
MKSENLVVKDDWYKKISNYLKQNFSKKNNLLKLLCFVIALIIVLVPSLTCNLLIRDGQWTKGVVYNDGIAFSALRGKTTLVYVIQSLICFVILIAIIFTNKWYYFTLLSLAFLGGLFNIVDRATQYLSPTSIAFWGPNTVIDYLNTGNTTSNFPDVFILIGVIGFTVLYLIMSIFNITREKKKSEKTETKEPINDEKNKS